VSEVGSQTRRVDPDAPPLVASFPLVFPNGAMWSSFKAFCNGCRCEMADLRGTVTKPYPTIFVVEAYGLCEPCRLITTVSYRLHDDVSMSGRSPTTGRWSRWEVERPWWVRLRRWARSLFP
jgi:hypothetical protein